MYIVVRQHQLSTLRLMIMVSRLSSSFASASLLLYPSSLTSASSHVSSNQPPVTSASSLKYILSTHIQPQQRTMRHYTINPNVKAFFMSVTFVLLALWIVSDSLLESVNLSLIPSQVETYWWLLRHCQLQIWFWVA